MRRGVRNWLAAGTTAILTVIGAGPAQAVTHAQAQRGLDGLNAILIAHPAHLSDLVTLRKCPLGSIPRMLDTSTSASGARLGNLPIRKSDIRFWSSDNDGGRRVECAAAASLSRYWLVAAEHHNNPIPRHLPGGFQGPTAFGNGRVYTLRTAGTCAATWVPPVTGYVISVVGQGRNDLTRAKCAASVTSIVNSVVRHLAAHA